jgi:hypothetical protein
LLFLLCFFLFTLRMAEFGAKPEERTLPWAAIGIGVGVVVVLVGVFWLMSRDSGSGSAGAADPYAANLKISELKVSAAQNLVGATVIYVEGAATNSGNKDVTHAVVRSEFKDTMGQVVLRSETPMMMTAERPGYSDNVDLSQSPLRAGESRPFRLTLEGVPASWNQAPPELKVVRVTTR